MITPFNAYNFPSVFSPPLQSFDLKHHPHHPCDDSPDGWEFDEDIINDDNNIITDINSNDSQQSILFDDKHDREFNNDNLEIHVCS